MRILDPFLKFYCQKNWRGFSRTWQFCQKFLGKEHIIAATPYDSFFHLNPLNYIDSIVLKEGYYESEIFEAILPFLGEGEVFWDIGSNFGLHAVSVKLNSPETRVIAFEPNPIMATAILRNANLNNVKIEVLSLALSGAREIHDLFINNSGNPGMSTLSPWSEGHYDLKVQICSERGDQLVSSKKIPQPTIIKIDTEGFEEKIADGMQAVLRNNSLKTIIFEAEKKSTEETNSKASLFTIIEQAGFQVRPLSRNEQTNHVLHNYQAQRR